MDLTITYAYDDAPFEILNDNFTSIIDRKYSMIIAVYHMNAFYTSCICKYKFYLIRRLWIAKKNNQDTE